MRVNASRFIPVMFEFDESEARHDGWGRFLELRANHARIITRVRLEQGQRLRLAFDLPGDRVQGLRADVHRSQVDEDGYTVCSLLIPEEKDRVRLGRTLQRILTNV